MAGWHLPEKEKKCTLMVATAPSDILNKYTYFCYCSKSLGCRRLALKETTLYKQSADIITHSKIRNCVNQHLTRDDFQVWKQINPLQKENSVEVILE